MKRHLPPLALLAALLSAAGCGDAPRSRVHGKITLRGQPIGPATVALLDSANGSHLADLGPDGSYAADGVARGPVRVSVQQALPHVAPRPDPPARPKVGVKAGESKDASAERTAVADPPPSAAKALANPLPPQYADARKSGLAFELTEPDQEFSADLK